MLVCSRYVEESHAADLLGAGGGVGYLLEDRVTRLDDLADALGLARDSADDHRRVLAVLGWLGVTIGR